MRTLVLSGLTLLLLDAVFLYLVAPIFNAQIIAVQGSPIKMNPLGAVLSYVFLIFALNYFILKENRPIKDAFLLGLAIYGTYEATSLALLREWRLQTVVIDTLWGGILFAATTAIVRRFVRYQ
jgi:uncharacterized membrane protein